MSTATTPSLPARQLHTPGPWVPAGRAIYTPSSWKEGRDSGQILIAQCFAEPDRDLPDCAEFLGAVKVPSNDCESDANARLIAAAPELLAACMSALRALEDNLQPGPMDADAKEGLRSAIARATGGAA